MAASLKKLAVRGAIWTIVGYGSGQGLRLVNNLILTRLLVPEFFGLMAFVITLRTGISLFSDYGISQSIVNNKRGEDQTFLNTAWSLQILRGFQIWAISLLLTYPVAQFYGDDRLFVLIPLVCFSSVLDGFSSTATHTLQRRLDLGKLTAYELILRAIELTVLIVLCWYSPTVYSLAIGTLVGATLNLVASHFLIPGYSNRLAWDRECLAELQSFGRWMALASSLMFVAEQSDRLLLAKLLSFQQLGVYTIANTLASIPREMVSQLSSRVIFPAISQQLHLPRRELRQKILRKRWIILLGMAVFLALLVCCGDWVIIVLYKGRNQNWDQYQQATWMLPLLAFGIWFSVLFYSTSPALLAIGKPVYSAQSNLARFITIAGGLPLAFSLYQTLGAILVVAFSDFPLYIVNLFALRKERLSCTTQDILATVAFGGILAVLLIVRRFAGFGTPIDVILGAQTLVR
ncbi:oligosaccharide flippase family protein [Myxacorys almedinensis]|uniref:Oligosaccharide flippase family protein n=1 Tax=Myxacorys almedinensis A TaxID=2690445 RepID=A0A8J8CJY5_9CYAN|nr:oligosaccharide flippase family protein [Myxacorys almedinensis]NDJ16070.1 oligosaccharide flippase family protein [Myxacorys almedinensis A]